MGIKADFETVDIDGSTIHYNGSVGTTPTTIPTVANKRISEFFIECDIDNTPVTKRLLFSCDGGATYTTIRPGESMIWTPKGRITQLYIKGNVAAVSYQMIVNYEDI